MSSKLDSISVGYWPIANGIGSSTGMLKSIFWVLTITTLNANCGRVAIITARCLVLIDNIATLVQDGLKVHNFISIIEMRKTVELNNHA